MEIVGFISNLGSIFDKLSINYQNILKMNPKFDLKQ